MRSGKARATSWCLDVLRALRRDQEAAAFFAELARKANFGESVADLVELERPDDGSDELHEDIHFLAQ